MNLEQHKAASAAILSLISDANRRIGLAEETKDDPAIYTAHLAASMVISAMANAMIAMRDAK